MEGQRKAGATLRPNTFDAGEICQNFSFVGGADRRNGELKTGVLQIECCDFDAVNALIQTVDGGFETAVRRFGYVEDQMEHGVTRLKRANPVAFERGRGMVDSRLIGRLRLRLGVGTRER